MGVEEPPPGNRLVQDVTTATHDHWDPTPVSQTCEFSRTSEKQAFKSVSTNIASRTGGRKEWRGGERIEGRKGGWERGREQRREEGIWKEGRVRGRKRERKEGREEGRKKELLFTRLICRREC